MKLYFYWITSNFCYNIKNKKTFIKKSMDYICMISNIGKSMDGYHA